MKLLYIVHFILLNKAILFYGLAVFNFNMLYKHFPIIAQRDQVVCWVFFFFWDPQADLELPVLPPQLLECWDHRNVPKHPETSLSTATQYLFVPFLLDMGKLSDFLLQIKQTEHPVQQRLVNLMLPVVYGTVFWKQDRSPETDGSPSDWQLSQWRLLAGRRDHKDRPTPLLCTQTVSLSSPRSTDSSPEGGGSSSPLQRLSVPSCLALTVFPFLLRNSDMHFIQYF